MTLVESVNLQVSIFFNTLQLIHPPGDGPVSPAPILPLIPPQSAERWKSPDTDLIRCKL